MLSLDSQAPTQSSTTNYKTVAIAVTAAAGLAIAGVVISTTESSAGNKLALINIPEEFSGTFTNTHNDGRYVLEGVFHKFEHSDGDWQIDAKVTAKGAAQSDSRYKVYTLLDDIFIEETFNVSDDARMGVHCMEPQGFPTYGQGKEMFKKAVAVQESELTDDMVKIAKQNCTVGSELSVVSENGKPWVICGDYSSENFEMTLMGNQITLKAKAVEGMVVDIQYPEDYDLELHNCTDRQDPIVHFNDFILKGADYEHRALDVETKKWPFKKEVESEARKLQGSPYACTMTQTQKCFIFHGVANAGMNAWDSLWGVRYPEQRDAVYDIGGGNPNGWGGYPEGYDDINQLNKAGNCGQCNMGSVYGMKNFNFYTLVNCVYSTFMDCDTQIRGYNSNSLHIEYNDTIRTSGYYSTGPMSANGMGRCAHNVFVVTHSMGGMIMAAGLIRNVVERRGFQWFQAQNPWYGSCAANEGNNLCNAIRHLSNPWIQLTLMIPGLNIAVIFFILKQTGVMSPNTARIAKLGLNYLGNIITGLAGMILKIIMIVAMLVLILINIFSGWNLSTPMINREICIEGNRIGKNNNRAYPNNANISIEFHNPWKFQGGQPMDFDNDGTSNISTNDDGFMTLQQNNNQRNRAPNFRMCGNHPWGFATDYEANKPFKHSAKSLERAKYDIKKKYDVVSDQGWSGSRNPRAYTHATYNYSNGASDMYANANTGNNSSNQGRWTNLKMYQEHNFKDAEDLTQNDSDWADDNMTNRQGFWSDGCVDVTNCMAYAQYSHSTSAVHDFITEHLHLNASNHDSGTCRAGKATSNYQDPCQRWEDFFSNVDIFYATFEQMPSYVSGMYNPFDYYLFFYGSYFWDPNATMDIWGGNGPPTAPPTFAPTHHPKMYDSNGMLINYNGGVYYGMDEVMPEGLQGPGNGSSGGAFEAQFEIGKGGSPNTQPGPIELGPTRGPVGAGVLSGGLPYIITEEEGYNVADQPGDFLSEAALAELDAIDNGTWKPNKRADMAFEKKYGRDIKAQTEKSVKEEGATLSAEKPAPKKK
jgi:hypothetical protein